jgi:hypothetical protein
MDHFICWQGNDTHSPKKQLRNMQLGSDAVKKIRFLAVKIKLKLVTRHKKHRTHSQKRENSILQPVSCVKRGCQVVYFNTKKIQFGYFMEGLEMEDNGVFLVIW